MSQIKDDGIAFIHYLRAIAPLFVLWAHLAGWWLTGYSQTWWVLDWYRLLIVRPLDLYQDGGHMGVILFFIISGYVISLSALRETRISFFIKRVFRLLPTLVLATFLMWAAHQIAPRLGVNVPMGSVATTPLEYLQSLLLIPSIPYAITVTWSLFPEILFYGLVIAVIPWLRDRPITTSWALLALAVLGAQAFRFLPLPYSFGPSLVYLPFFIFGRALFLIHSRPWDKLQAIAVGIAAYALFILNVVTTTPGFIAQSWSSYAVATILFVGAMMWSPKTAHPVARFMADISYDLYLLHVPVGFMVLNILDQTGLRFSIRFAIATAVVIFASWLCFKFVDKPSQAFARRLVSLRLRPLATVS